MSQYKLNVPLVNYHEVNLTTKDLISMLEQEKKSICEGWDCIIKYHDKFVYHDHGYGSHNVGEKYGEEVDATTLENYQSISKVIQYLKSK